MDMKLHTPDLGLTRHDNFALDTARLDADTGQELLVVNRIARLEVAQNLRTLMDHVPHRAAVAVIVTCRLEMLSQITNAIRQKSRLHLR